MLTEFRTNVDLYTERLKADETLKEAREDESRLIADKKITAHRLDDRTIVITNPSTFKRFKKG